MLIEGYPGYRSAAAAAAKSLQSCLTLCDPVDSSPPGSPVSRILQARTLEWVTIPFSKGSSRRRDQTPSLVSRSLAGRFFTTEQPGDDDSMDSKICYLSIS